MKRRKLLVGGLLFAALVALVAFGRFPQARLKRSVEARLGEALGATVTIGSLRVVPALLSAEAENVSIVSPQLTARVAEARITATRELLRGRSVSLRSLDLRGLSAEVRASDEGGAARGTLPEVRIERLDVRDASLRYHDPALGNVALAQIDAHGAVGSGGLDVTLGRFTWEREPETLAGSASARLELRPDLTATLPRAEVRVGASRIQAAGRLGSLNAPAPDVRFHGELDAGELAPLANAGPATGRLEVAGRVLGLAPLSWELETSTPALVAAGVGFADLQARASGSAAAASVTAGAAVMGGRISLEAKKNGDAVDLRLEAKEVRAADVPVSASVRASGTAAPEAFRLSWTLDGQATPSVAVEGGSRLASITLKASGTATKASPLVVAGQGAGTLNLVAADGTERSVPFEGTLRTRDAAAEELSLRVPEFDLAGLVPDLTGFAGLSLDASGRLDRLGGSARFDARDLAWRTTSIGALNVEGTGQSGDWVLAAQLPDHVLRVEARSPFPGRGERRVSGTATFSGTSLAAVGPFLPAAAPRDARLEGQVEFEAALAQPAAMTARSDLTLAGEGYSFRIEGGFGAAPSAPLDLHVAGKASLDLMPAPQDVEIAGTMEADVRIRGTRLAPQAEGQAGILATRVSGKGLPEVAVQEARLTFDPTGAELKPAEVALAGGTLTVRGRYPFAEASEAEIHAQWANLLAEQLLSTRTPRADAAPLTGRISGTADFSGRGIEVGNWRGEATLKAETLRAADMSLELTPIVVRLDRRTLAFEPVTLTSGPGSLVVGGRVDLASREVDIRGQGTMDLRALSPLVGNTSLAGVAEVDVAVGGRPEAPEPRGAITIKDASVRSREIPEALTQLRGRIVLDGSVLRVEDVRAALGGGDVTVSGEARRSGLALESAAIVIEGRNVNLRYPVGLKSRLDADLRLEGGRDGLAVRGDVRVQRGLYDLDVAVGDAVKTPVVEPEPSPALRAIGLDIAVVLVNPVLIRNRLANLDVTGSLQFQGDLETPAPFGRVNLQGGGKIYLRGRDFLIEEGGGLTYAGDWDPAVKMIAARRLFDQSTNEERTCRVTLDGPLTTVQPGFGCDGIGQGPSLALIATGRSAGTAGQIGAQVAGEQAASVALGRLTQGLGFEEVAVQPELLARDTEPGARFTFGKQLTRVLSLIYSISLEGPEQRFTQVEWRLPRNVSLKGQRTDDGVLAAGIGQRLRFGRTRKASAGEDLVRLRDVRFEGELPDEAQSKAQSKKGKRVAPWDVQEDADRVRQALVEQGYIEAEVSGRLEDDVAVLRVQTGPRFLWLVTGMENPPDLRDAFRKALYEQDAVEHGREQIVQTLRERGHLRGRVKDVRAEVQESGRLLVFEVEPGPILQADVSFPGASRLSQRRLLAVAGGPGALVTEAPTALRRIEDAYREQGRLGASAGPVQVQDGGSLLTITVPVNEGEPPRVSAVTFTGATLSEEELQRASGLVTGAPFDPDALDSALEQVRRFYYERGHAQVRVSVDNTIRGADVEVRFRVREGAATVVGAIEIQGLRRTRESIVRRHIHLKAGEVVDPRRLADLERRIMEMGVFASVFVTASDESPATITVEVVEKDRLEVAYDLRWSEDQSGTVQVDSEVRNLVGIGLDLGGRYREGADDRERRLSLHMPAPLLRGTTTVAAFETDEDLDATDPFTGEPFTNTQTERGFEFQYSQRVKRHTTMHTGYRFKTVFSTAFPLPIHIGTLFSGALRETRDNPLDARRGQFAAFNLEVSPKAVGSDLTFMKGFAQFFVHRRLARSWTWSQGYRIGLAHGFGGQEVVPSERFKAGGPDSLRGFATDSVGPKDFLGEPAGGDAVLIFNQELRYRHQSGWGFAVFWDFGNVFEKASDLELDLRHDLGAGLRWASPIGMLRLDLAFPLARQPEEDRYRLNFSLGQIF